MVQSSDIIYEYNMECISFILHYCGQLLDTDNLKEGLILAPLFLCLGGISGHVELVAEAVLHFL